MAWRLRERQWLIAIGLEPVKTKEFELLQDEWSVPIVKDIIVGQDGICMVNTEEEAMKAWRTAKGTIGCLGHCIAKMRYADISEEVCSEVLFRVKDMEAAMDGATPAPRALRGVRIAWKESSNMETGGCGDCFQRKSRRVMIVELRKNFVKPDVWIALSSLQRYKGLLHVLRVLAAPSKEGLASLVEAALETYVAKNGGERTKIRNGFEWETTIIGSLSRVTRSRFPSGSRMSSSQSSRVELEVSL